MKLLRNLLFLVLGLVALVFLVGLFLPTDYHLEKDIVVNATPEQVYPYVSTFENRNSWYPWYRRDPNMSTELKGPDGQVGAVSSWNGDPNTVGSGTQTFARLVENERVETDLVFTEPFESSARSFVNLKGDGAKTRVTWGFDTRANYPGNIFMYFMGLESAVGKDYVEGLEKLKEVVESDLKEYGGYIVRMAQMPEQAYLIARDKVNFGEMESFQQARMQQLMMLLSKSGTDPSGPTCHLYYDWNEEIQVADMAIAIPVESAPANLPSGIAELTLPAAASIYVDHMGSYDGLGPAHEAIDKYIRTKGKQVLLPAVEQYILGPDTESNPEKWQTRIYYPLVK